MVAAVWSPSRWEEVTGLLEIAPEGPTLDFKRDPPGDPPEVAKDIAAMSANGGVLLYGVEEDPKRGVAVSLRPFPVKGVEERVRLIAGARISPPLSFETTMIEDPDQPGMGVLVLTVPASANAPHQAGGRFPVRYGTTTRDLSEPEIDRLYRQRWELAAMSVNPEEAIADYQLPPGVGPDRASTLTHWLGRLRLVVGNAAQLGASHPDYPDYYAALRRAWHGAVGWTDSHLNTGPVTVLKELADWRPFGTTGWAAGHVEIPDEGTSGVAAYGAVLAYPSAFSFWLSWPLWVGDEDGYCCVEEWRVTAELTAVLALAGHFLIEVPGAGPIACAMELSGFDGAVAWSNTRGRAGISVQGMPTAPDSHLESALTSGAGLVSEPHAVARDLLARWLMAFYSGRDLVETITQ